MLVVGIDEVGRGAWAGPVVAGAVVLPTDFDLPGLGDSKKLSKRTRQRLALQVRQQAVAIGLGWVSSTEIDAQGLSWAVRQSGLRALSAIGMDYDRVILDGRHNYLSDLPCATEAIIGADASVPAVSAGAIVAKVARDSYMHLLGIRHPQFQFERHVGYGTAVHQKVLRQSGPTPAHRRSYKPVRELV
jgi:ribonuclease HII